MEDYTALSYQHEGCYKASCSLPLTTITALAAVWWYDLVSTAVAEFLIRCLGYKSGFSLWGKIIQLYGLASILEKILNSTIYWTVFLVNFIYKKTRVGYQGKSWKISEAEQQPSEMSYLSRSSERKHREPPIPGLSLSVSAPCFHFLSPLCVGIHTSMVASALWSPGKLYLS